MATTDWGRRGQSGFTRDPNNEQLTPLPANGVFTGQWTRVDKAESFCLLYGTTAPFSMRIEWSKDGVVQDTDPFATTSPQVRSRLGLYSVISFQSTYFRPYYRMKITNGASAQIFVVSDALMLNTIFPGYQIDIDGPIPVLGLANLNHGLMWGRTPTDWQPTQLTALKNQKVALAENLLGNLPMAVQNWPALQPVAVSNFPVPPAVQPVSSVGGSYHHRNTPGTAVIKSGPGVLRSVIRNKYGSTTTLVLYDGLNALAPVIADIGFTLAGSATAPSQLDYNLNFSTGLTVVQVGTADVTVVFS